MPLAVRAEPHEGAASSRFVPGLEGRFGVAHCISLARRRRSRQPQWLRELVEAPSISSPTRPFRARATLYIENLYVLPEQRGQGAGKAMLAAFARIAMRKKCGRMEWAVLDWNRPAIAFYERLGARMLKEWIPVRVTGGRLARLAQR